MNKYLLFFAATFLHIVGFGQVFVNSYESSHVSSKGIFGSGIKISEIILSPIDTVEQSNQIKPERVHKSAEPEFVNISPLLEASKETNGSDFVYKQRIIAQEATSIAITFDKLNLSKNAELYLYNPEGTLITGPITAKENIGTNKINKLWSSNSFIGNTMILELRVPQAEVNQNELHIVKTYFGLPKKVYLNKLDSANIGRFNNSSPCNINVLCPSGSNWQNERKAVCLIETENRSNGSGALVNNTCNTLIPYILTAWHNTNGNNPNNWTFLFGWWSSTCISNTNTTQSILFNGATLRATYEPTDFSLIELNQMPDASLDLSLLGWD